MFMRANHARRTQWSMLENGGISLDFEARCQISHGMIMCVFIVGIITV